MYINVPNGTCERPANNESGKDWFGVEWLYEETGNAPLPNPFIEPVVSDISKWREQVVFPDLDAWDWQKAVELDKPEEIDKENLVHAVWLLNGIFERPQTLMGMEEAFVALMTEPEEFAAFVTAVADFKIKLYEKVIEYYEPDIICQHDDYGTQYSMMLSPELWRQIVKPNLERMAAFCHERGVFYEQHSCGLVEPIVPDLAEIGVASWQGQHINNIPELKKQTAGRLNYFTTLDVQKISELEATGQLDEDRLRQEIRTTVEESAVGGCYIPFMYSMDPDWWVLDVAMDELANCSADLKY